MLLKILKSSVSVVLVFTMLILATSTVWAADTMHEDNSMNDESIQNKLSFDEDVEKLESYTNEYIYEVQIKDIIADPEKGVDDLNVAILKKDTYYDGLTTKHEIKNVDTLVSALKLKYPTMNDIDLGKTILRSLGDTEEFISTLPDEKIVEALGYISVVKTESFYKQNADGEKIEISEQDYYEEIARVEAEEQLAVNSTDNEKNTIKNSTRTSSAYDETETKDSYIKLTSTAYKTNPSYALDGRNYFTIRGEVEWTKTPFVRGKDILAIASSGNVDQDYSAFAYAYWPVYSDIYIEDYAYIDQNDGEGEIAFGNALKIYNPSIYGIAIDVYVSLADDLGILEYAYVYYGISTQEDVTCQVGYAHRTIGIGDPSVSIDSSGALSFSVGLMATMNDYYGNAFTLYHESYNVAPISPSTNSTIAYNSAAPTFSWNSYGGLSKQYILEIDYLGNGSNSYMSRTINTSTSYTLSESDWRQIVYNSPFSNNVKVIKWRIKIKYIKYPNETPYCTAWSTFSITGVPLDTREVLSTITANTRYTEKTVNLSADTHKDFVIKFATGGTQLIQTFGTKDTVLELYSSSGTLLLGRSDTDDKGYSTNALLSYNFSANTEYVVRVKFYSSSTSGITKLSIIPTYTYATYEDIYSLTDYTMGLTWSFAQNNVKVMTYKYSVTQDLTMNVTSEVDTYLYIIDPRSTELIKAASTSTVGDDNLYNDDYGGTRNSKITKTFDANVPYLVIVSAYNPSSSTSVGEFYVNFD